jgi:glycosyltransferase involved in cell wall biosynthesis
LGEWRNSPGSLGVWRRSRDLQRKGWESGMCEEGKIDYSQACLPAADGRDRPLVTFALFAFNQEKYIREAVEGAFSQTYEPLEIILSDDSSTDQTFEIMQDMAAAYTGPHRIIVRRTDSNRGPFHHVLEVASEMSGRIMVVAAGDDISYPHRCNTIVRFWRESEAEILFSYFDLIDEDGALVQAGVAGNCGIEIMKWFSPESELQQTQHGASAAYSAEFLKQFHFPDQPILSEDVVFYFAATLNNSKLNRIERPLIKYRKHRDALSNADIKQTTEQEVVLFEKRIARGAHASLALCDYCCDFMYKAGVTNRLILMRSATTRRFAKICAAWIDTGFLGRTALLAGCREWRDFRFLLPRMFGLLFFAKIKSSLVRARNGSFGTMALKH